MEAKNILLFGATGLIGTHILEALIQSKDSFSRIAIYTSPGTVERKPDVLDAIKKSGVDVIVGEVGDEKRVGEAYQGIDTVISALGRDALSSQLSLINAAASSPSVKWFLPSEYGTDIEYSPASANERPHQMKLKIRAALRALPAPSEEASVEGKLYHTYVVTGPFAEGYLSREPAGPEGGSFDVKAKKANLLGEGGKGRVSLTTMVDVGKLVVAALKNPSASRNKALRVNSFTTTPEDILAEFEKQTGGEKWEKTYTPLDRLKELEEKAWAEGVPTATIFTLRRIWTEGGTLYDVRDNGVIGEPDTESLEDVVRRSVQRQTGSG
ncbi:hypothetical protein FQN54_009482 [Arachnomyces sp. PD_36]|nr:hypothetical protein FQN54_009482 [Arachnomyces sp. PD_36]